MFSQHFGEVRTLLNFGFDFDLARDLLARAGVAFTRDLVLEFPSSSFFWARGAAVGWQLPTAGRLLVEVFPHPATIRLFGLEQIVKYKRGPVAARRAEFARLQGLLRECLRTRFAPGEWPETPALTAVLSAPWTKPAEDRLDALLCALVGYHHWRHDGRRSETLGDLETGFILVPAADEAG